MYVFVRKTYKTSTGNSFALTDQCFDNTNDFGINLVGFFGLEKLTCFSIDLACQPFIIVDRYGKILDKLQVTQYIIIPHGRIAGSLVSDMYIVSLIRQTDKRTTHRNHIV